MVEVILKISKKFCDLRVNNKLAGKCKTSICACRDFPYGFPYTLIFSITGIAVEVLMVANDRVVGRCGVVVCRSMF